VIVSKDKVDSWRPDPPLNNNNNNNNKLNFALEKATKAKRGVKV
jgi:hypothetical protein